MDLRHYFGTPGPYAANPIWAPFYLPYNVISSTGSSYVPCAYDVDYYRELRRADVYKTLDSVAFSPSAGICTPSPTNMAILRLRNPFRDFGDTEKDSSEMSVETRWSGDQYYLHSNSASESDISQSWEYVVPQLRPSIEEKATHTCFPHGEDNDIEDIQRQQLSHITRLNKSFQKMSFEKSCPAKQVNSIRQIDREDHKRGRLNRNGARVEMHVRNKKEIKYCVRRLRNGPLLCPNGFPIMNSRLRRTVKRSEDRIVQALKNAVSGATAYPQ